MNKNELDFAVFCVESVAELLNIDGAVVYTKLTDDSNLLYEYIVKHYDSLHTQDKEYITQDIIDAMCAEGLV